MTNQTFKTSLNIKDNPSYFGVYLNMARHNIKLIDNHLQKKFSRKKPVKDDENIPDSFLTKYNDQNPNHLYSHLIRFVPSCSIFDAEFMVTRKEKKEDPDILNQIAKGKDFETLANTLKFLFKDINKLRNNYTHFAHTDSNWVRGSIISSESKTFIEKVYYHAIKYCKRRFKDVLAEELFDQLTWLPLFEKENENELNQDGLVFLICLFLEREFLFLFINKVQKFKNATTPEFKAKREVFAAFALRLPHEKMLSDDPKLALELDILNELKKVPKEIFHNLNEEQQIPFRANLTEEAETNMVDNSVREDEEDLETYLTNLQAQYRKGNRFHYLALRLIDEKDMFKLFRIQISLGKYVKSKYLKSFNNEQVDREIVENVYTFGKLNQFNDEDEIANIINEKALPEQGFENYSPKYVMRNNKFQLKFYGGSENELDIKSIGQEGKSSKFTYHQPHNITVSISLNELDKILLLEYFKAGEVENLIKDFVQQSNKFIFDENAINTIKEKLSSIETIYKRFDDIKAPKDAMDGYKKEIESRKKVLDAELKVYKLDSKSIPSKLVNYMINLHKNGPSYKIKRSIKAIKASDSKKVKDFDKGVMPKIGEMATLIAKDIIDLIINLEIKTKATSFYYDKMQECLALYANSNKRNEFAIIIKELGLRDKVKGHPFLDDIKFESFEDTATFFRAYFYKKAGAKGSHDKYSWMYKTFYSQEKDKNGNLKTKISLPDKGVPYVYLNLKKEDNIKELSKWIGQMPKQSIDLPTNIFDKPLREAIVDKQKQEGKQIIPAKNYSVLLKEWYGGLDAMQTFYSLPRAYQVYDKTFVYDVTQNMGFKKGIEKIATDITTEKKKDAKKRFDVNYTKQSIKQLLHREITHNEKAIRLIQEQDMALVLHLPKEYKIEKLNGIDNVLNEQIDLTLNIHGKLITDTRKRKDFGLLNRVKYDNRLASLLSYVKESTVSYAYLREELRKYNDLREWIFEKVFDVEEKLMNIHRDEILRLFVNSDNLPLTGNVKHNPYLTFLMKKGKIDEDKMNNLKKIRDKFSHNEVPQELVNGDLNIFEFIQTYYQNTMPDIDKI